MNWTLPNCCLWPLSIIIVALNLIVAEVSAETIPVDSVLIRLIDEVDVPARALGSLVEVHAIEGTPVKQGELLAQIDDSEAELESVRAAYELDIASRDADNDVAVRSAVKSLTYAKAHYDRLQRADLAQPRSVSQSELEKARLDVEQTEFELEKSKSELQNALARKQLAANTVALAERNIEVRKIVAPLTGIVVESPRQSGEWVTPGEKIFRIVSTKRLRAEGFVQAGDVKSDLTGATVRVETITSSGSPQSLPGHVVFVSPEIDPINGQVRVWAEVDNQAELLRPGLRARMTITSE